MERSRQVSPGDVPPRRRPEPKPGSAHQHRSAGERRPNPQRELVLASLLRCPPADEGPAR
jgi:hypothetical protein